MQKKTLKRNKYGEIKYKGVTWVESNKKFVSKITVDGSTKYLGYFKTAKDAAKAFNKYIMDNNLSKKLNYIPNDIEHDLDIHFYNLQRSDHFYFFSNNLMKKRKTINYRRGIFK